MNVYCGYPECVRELSPRSSDWHVYYLVFNGYARQLGFVCKGWCTLKLVSFFDCNPSHQAEWFYDSPAALTGADAGVESVEHRIKQLRLTSVQAAWLCLVYELVNSELTART